VAADRGKPRGALLLTAFGLGRFPHAPGSVASLATLATVVLLDYFAGVGALAAGVLFAFGVLTTLIYGDAKGPSGRHDPSWIVTDEVAGQSLACAGGLLFPIGPPMLVAFLMFRVFDVWKPGPVRRLESLPGGLGVLFDDLLAGLFAGVLAVGVGFALRPWGG
jgi:phosphatidylglycerophosphatase A